MLACRLHAGDFFNFKEWIFIIGQIIIGVIGRIRFFGDLLHAFVSSGYCLSACWLVFKATNRCEMIRLRAQVTGLTICFAFFFPMLLCCSASAAILLHALCSLSILSIFCVFLLFVPLFELFCLTVHGVDLLICLDFLLFHKLELFGSRFIRPANTECFIQVQFIFFE